MLSYKVPQAYFNEIKKYKPLTKKEEKKLLYRYRKKGDLNARNKLITANLKYACKLASLYNGRGVPFSDLISEANNGLIESIDKFDINSDVKIFCYAKWWILQKMQLAIGKNNKIKYSDLPETDDNKDGLIENDSTFYDDENDYDSEFIDDLSVDNDNSDYIFLNDVCSVLSDRELDMINMYYGRNYDKEYTLEEIGEKYNLTKERSRQIIDHAFSMLRSHAMLIENTYVSK